jgi:hypothetical protein
MRTNISVLRDLFSRNFPPVGQSAVDLSFFLEISVGAVCVASHRNLPREPGVTQPAFIFKRKGIIGCVRSGIVSSSNGLFPNFLMIA